jgi:hypothetical protein
MNKPYHFLSGRAVRGALLCTIAGAFIFSNCRTASVPVASGAKGCMLIVNYPLVMAKSEGINMYNLLDTISIFSISEYKIYKLTKVHVLETNEPIPGSEPFFVFKKGESHGVLFRTLTDSVYWQKLPTDSLLRTNGYAGVEFTPDPRLKLAASFSVGNSNVIEKYATPVTTDPNKADSVYFYFSRSYKDIDYTFSQALDSMRNMKLYKARFIFNEKTYDSANVVMPKREIFFEMQPAAVTDYPALARLIRNYERFYKEDRKAKEVVLVKQPL